MCRFLVESICVVVCALPLAATAGGQFQDFTKEELQMTVDPKAPGAKAVYLYCEDVQDDLGGTRTYYARVKILTEKGIEKATVHQLHGAGITGEVEGRTIHKDGTIIPLTEKPSELTDYKTKGQEIDSLVFTLPSAEVGSILEYRIKFRFHGFLVRPRWKAQLDLFVHKEHFVYKPDTLLGLAYTARMPRDAHISIQAGTYSLFLEDVPPLPDEDWMPPLNAYQWRVSFYQTRSRTVDEFWRTEAKFWATFVRDFTVPTGPLQRAAEDLVGASDSEMLKAQKIYAAVLKLENTDFTRQKSKAELKHAKMREIGRAEDVWKNRSGSGDEITLLFVALCRALHLKVAPMEVVDRSTALFDQELLDSSQLDDYIAVAELDGHEVYLDPGEKVCPFGMLLWAHTLTTGFRLEDKTAKIERTPSGSFNASNLVRSADLTIDASGELRGTVRCTLQGQEAVYWRQFALKNDENEVKKQFNEWMNGYLPAGVQGDFDHFLALDQYDSNLLAIVRVSGNPGAVTGKRLFLPGLFFASNSKHPFVLRDKREIPVDVHYARTEQDDVNYRIPAGFEVESGPQAHDIAWPQHAILSISTSKDSSLIEIKRKLAFSYSFVDPKEYGDLHDFYQEVSRADQQQLILRRTGATGGN